MKAVALALIVAPLLLVTAPPSTATSAAVQLVAVSDQVADRDSYKQKAEADMREWRRKLHDFGAKAEATGKQAGDTAKSDLDQAWASADDAAAKLKAAGDKDWESAKARFETATHELAEAWRRINPNDQTSQHPGRE